MTSYFSYSL